MITISIPKRTSYDGVIPLSDLEKISQLRDIDLMTWVGICVYFGLGIQGYVRREPWEFRLHVTERV